MNTEKKYEFRKRLDDIHPFRLDRQAVPVDNECVVDGSWKIICSAETLDIAQDLQDYFARSMDLLLPLSQNSFGNKEIRLNISGKGKKRGYHLHITANLIEITGNDIAGCRNGAINIEDRMNLREAPFIAFMNESFEVLFSPRMIHSGWGLDQFPDSHLNSIVHAGFDSILLFAKGPNQTTHGFMDFNDLIQRAKKFSLDVYFYSYLPSFKHPDDPDADEFFDQSYGSVFRNSPDARGLILVGESCGFPSKDPACTNLPRNKETMGKVTGMNKEFPGFYPCNDYPQWLNAVKKAVRRYSPDAEIIFWSYNWGKFPADLRCELINNLPDDVILEATFEMYEYHRYPNHTMVQPDYSITFPGPGYYFSTEAECAKKRNLPVYAMTNSAGRTWDFGIVPYMPFPQQWFKRFTNMVKSHDEWGVDGIMDTHHYGWFPSVISECAKWCFTRPSPSPEVILKKILQRDFGKEAAEIAEKAFQLLSDAMDSYTPGFDDQAGPLRCGPSYPFIFHPIHYPHYEHKLEFPTTPASAVGARWIHPFYQPEHFAGFSWCGRRIAEDIKIFTETAGLWQQGCELLAEAVETAPESKRQHVRYIYGVAKFCYHSFMTMLNIKKWWLLNRKLEISSEIDEAMDILDQMEQLLDDEIVNVRESIPLVEADSSLGWEPSMDYIADREHLEWKIRQVENVKCHTIPAYRKTIHG